MHHPTNETKEKYDKMTYFEVTLKKFDIIKKKDVTNEKKFNFNWYFWCFNA